VEKSTVPVSTGDRVKRAIQRFGDDVTCSASRMAFVSWYPSTSDLESGLLGRPENRPTGIVRLLRLPFESPIDSL